MVCLVVVPLWSRGAIREKGKMPCSFQAGLQKYGLQIGSFQQRPMLTRPAELLYAALAAA